MDVNNLMYALDNENNEGIIHLTSKKILEMNLNIIKELHRDRETTLNYLKKLKGYRYVDEINDIKYGGAKVLCKDKFSRLCLHAYKINIENYFGKTLNLQTPRPNFTLK